MNTGGKRETKETIELTCPVMHSLQDMSCSDTLFLNVTQSSHFQGWITKCIKVSPSPAWTFLVEAMSHLVKRGQWLLGQQL